MGWEVADHDSLTFADLLTAIHLITLSKAQTFGRWAALEAAVIIPFSL